MKNLSIARGISRKIDLVGHWDSIVKAAGLEPNVHEFQNLLASVADDNDIRALQIQLDLYKAMLKEAA
jgi:hypothetical protein